MTIGATVIARRGTPKRAPRKGDEPMSKPAKNADGANIMPKSFKC